MNMKRKQKTAVIFGGNSPEYLVSLQSASAIISHLDPFLYDIIMVGITREGNWYRFYGGAKEIEADLWHRSPNKLPAVISPCTATHGLLEFCRAGVRETRIDVAFPVLHGKNGEDGTVQGLLELAGIPVVGCGTATSAVCMDKVMAHRLAAEAGVAVTRSVVLHKDAHNALPLQQTASFHYPLFVKPARAGSSFGVSKVESEAALPAAISAAFAHDDRVIIEEGIPGFEVGCAIMGNEDLVIGEIDEIELVDGFFDYREKYTLESAKIHMPARISPETAAQIRKTAATVYRTLGCRGFARVDLFLTPEDRILFNEVNTIPGFTAHSRFPSMMQGAGYRFEEILDRLIGLAV